MPKNRLTILVGSGASVGIGVPDTRTATELVVSDPPDELTARSREQTWILRQTLGVLQQVYKTPPANFEHLLHALEALVTLERSWRPDAKDAGRTIWSVLAGGPRSELLPLFREGAAAFAVFRFLDQLHSVFEAPKPWDERPENWAAYTKLWSRLSETFDLDVVTTNYDAMIERALPAIRHGFVDIASESAQRFSLADFIAGDHRLAYVHGSIHFGYRREGDPNRFIFEDDWHDLYRYDDPSEARNTWGIRSHPRAMSGEELVVGPLLSGFQKPDKVLAIDPFHTYYVEFANWIRSNPRLLVLGYGFGDRHINGVLSRLTKLHGANRKVAVVTWMPEQEWVLAKGGHNRLEESYAIARWSEEAGQLWRETMVSYEDTWTSKNGRCRVHLNGLTNVAANQLEDLIAFLR
jgi:hypothetical protein